MLAASRNDPLCDFTRAQALAHDWGSTLEDIGAVGHLNPAAGFGAWPAAEALIALLDTQADYVLVMGRDQRLRGVIEPRDFIVSSSDRLDREAIDA